MTYRVLAFLCLVSGSLACAQDADAPQSAFSEAQNRPLADQYTHGLFSAGESAKFALALVYDQATVAVPEWGSDRAGLARRAEWLAATHLTRYSTEFATAKLLRTDTSYQRCRCAGFPGGRLMLFTPNSSSEMPPAATFLHFPE